MTRKRWAIVGSAVLVLLVALFVWKRPGASAAPKYRTAAIERGEIESVVSATGTIQPVEQVEVGSQVSGTVNRIAADYNSRVTKGQVLCTIDPSAFRARVVEAQAAVAKANAVVLDAERAAARIRTLFQQNYVAQAEVDATEVAVTQRRAERQQARAALQVAQVDLDHTVIRTPIDGVVIARSIDLGQTVAASLQAPKLFVIANDLTRMQVETKIDEADIGRIRQGLQVRFNVDAFPDQTFHGVVAQVRLEPITEQNVTTYTTVIRTENPDLRLRPGMTANVSVEVARRDDVLRVPAAALRFRPPSEQRRGGGANRSSQTAGGASGRAVARADESPAGARAGRASGGASGGNWRQRREAGAMGATGGGGRGAGPGSAGNAAMTPGAVTGGEVVPASVNEEERSAPGTVYVLRNGKPVKIEVTTGLSDGSFSEVRTSQLKEGDLVVVGVEQAAQRGNQLTPPPGMGGGRGFGGGRGR